MCAPPCVQSIAPRIPSATARAACSSVRRNPRRVRASQALPGPPPARRNEFQRNIAMSRSINRFSFSGSALTAVLLALGVLAGCASTPSAISDIRYDLGPATQPSSVGTMPAIKVLEVTAPVTLDSDKLVYRLSYSD